MNEQKWLAAGQAVDLLILLNRSNPRLPTPSNRKLRLFACICCWRRWRREPNGPCRDAIETVEDFADGLVDEEELARVAAACERMRSQILYHLACGAAWKPEQDATNMAAGVSLLATMTLGRTAAAAFDRELADLLRDILGNYFRPVRLRGKRCSYKMAYCGQKSCSYCVANFPHLVAPGEEVHCDDDAIRVADKESRRLGLFFREFLTPQVLALAEVAYRERQEDYTLNPARLAVLADALEEAGCDHEEVLTHLHSPGPHARGCWAVDLLLEKT